MEKFTISNGVAIRYAVFGKGINTILLIHGYLESSEVWELFAGKLGKAYRIITIDLPGSGFSDWGERNIITVDFMADVCADILDKTDTPKCSVVGHSMGGYVALALAERFPDKINHLVLLHSSPNPDTEEKKINRQREIELIMAGKKEIMAKLNPARGFANVNMKRCEEQIEQLHDQVMMTDDKAIIATLKGLMERDDRNAFFDSFSKPKLMIFGTDDNYIPLEDTKRLIEQHPSSHIAWIENAGHMSFIEQPEQTLNAIQSFILNTEK